jgi:hypothetical protein
MKRYFSLLVVVLFSCFFISCNQDITTPFDGTWKAVNNEYISTITFTSESFSLNNKAFDGTTILEQNGSFHYTNTTILLVLHPTYSVIQYNYKFIDDNKVMFFTGPIDTGNTYVRQ